MKRTTKNQIGAVSIFVVIFASLLITVVTIAFVSLMMKDQEQATAADLSQSAYDSAQAGVEDAKRALLQYKSICEAGTSDPAACMAAKLAIDVNSSPECNASVNELSDIDTSSNSNKEVEIKTGTSDSLNQAYTCVKVDLDTSDYLGILSADSYDLIPLTGVGSFDTIRIDWFSSDNVSSANNYAVSLNSTAVGSQPLFNQADWPANRPSLIQAQLIQYGSGFTLDGFRSSNALGESNDNTLFLYPVSSVTLSSYSFTAQDSAIKGGGATPVQCRSDLSSGGYACSIELSLPAPIGGGTRTAFLHIGALYNNTDFRISLYSGGALVDFNGVQPEIDSTGRANDLFRRVKVRVRMLDTDFPYPNAAVHLSGGLCKNFIVTDQEGGYNSFCD